MNKDLIDDLTREELVSLLTFLGPQVEGIHRWILAWRKLHGKPVVTHFPTR